MELSRLLADLSLAFDMQIHYIENRGGGKLSCADCPEAIWFSPSAGFHLGRCPAGNAFARLTQEGGTLLAVPIPGQMIADLPRISALRTQLEAALSLLEKRGLLRRGGAEFDILTGYIDRHLADDLSPKTLQKLLYMSPSSIARLIKRESGRPLRLYIQYRRLQAAASLLRATDMPIAQIAERCGISDPNYFSRIFKRHFKLTPSAFRMRPALGRCPGAAKDLL